MLTISQAYHSPNHDARTEPISAIVIHSCEGTPPGNEQRSSIPWLCNPSAQVSCHYYITREGDVYQLVPEDRRAWHAGIGTLSGDPNSCSIGIELEHRRGSAAYSAVQLAHLAKLCRDLCSRYAISTDRVVSHRAMALPAGRKQDPTDWSEPAFRQWVAVHVAETPSTPPTPIAPYTEDSLILGTGHATTYQLRKAVPATIEYTRKTVDDILYWYVTQCAALGINHDLAIAQMIHETAALTSWWAQRQRRNPAGIGVTSLTSDAPTKPPGSWSRDGKIWREGCSFRTWQQHAIPAHLGRLLAYALLPTERNTHQQHAVDTALSYRALPIHIHGTAPTLRLLGQVHNPSGHGWAKPGRHYGERIAAIANRILGAS